MEIAKLHLIHVLGQINGHIVRGVKIAELVIFLEVWKKQNLMLVPGQVNGHIVRGIGIAKFDTCPGTNKWSYCKGC